MSNSIALAAGGTGGHIYPALALAEEIQSQTDPPAVVFFAANRPLDRQIMSGAARQFRENFRCVYLAGSAFGGQSGLRKLGSMMFFGVAFMSAWWNLRKCRCLVAFGGYASVAASAAAKVRGIPIYIHEQNAVPGRANRLLASLSQKIFLTFGAARGRFGKHGGKSIVTGCPVRKKILVDRQPASRSRMRLLVVGGSQGAKFFLDFFLGRPEFFAWLLERVDVLFLAGSGPANSPHAIRLVENAKHLRGSFTLLPFLERMGPAIRSSDIILSRSGASFLAELASVGKARTILVPFPAALDDHQTANAHSLAADLHSLAELHIFGEDQAARIEETLHSAVLKGPVDPPPSFPDAHAGAACRILEEIKTA